jgi:hypothetical protein
MPVRVLAGQATRLSRTMHDIRYDAVHDEIFVTNPFAQAILTFRGNADGEEAPIRVIQGPHTQIIGGQYLDRVDVDPIHNEIFVHNSDAILVFPRDGNGDAAPIRVIRGPDTQMRRLWGIAVDPVNNLVVVGYLKTGIEGYNTPGSERETGGLLIFNRTDNGNVKPRAVITGPKTGLLIPDQLQVYGPGGWIVVPQSSDAAPLNPGGTFVGVWSIHDNGDVPPHWKIGGPNSTIIKPRGVALDPEHKEIFVADMSLNSVLTYRFPALFQNAGSYKNAQGCDFRSTLTHLRDWASSLNWTRQ